MKAIEAEMTDVNREEVCLMGATLNERIKIDWLIKMSEIGIQMRKTVCERL